MLPGILFVTVACSLWGLIFVMPFFMQDLSSAAVIAARYYFYGLFSLALACLSGFSFRRHLSRKILLKAFAFALFAQLGYYLCIVLSVRFATGAITTMVMGTAPITIAVYGQWSHPNRSFKPLILPSIVILGGLLLVNLHTVFHTAAQQTLAEYLFGLACSLMALTAWTWYAVDSAKLLKSNPQITPANWSTLVGLCTLFWVVLGTLAYLLGTQDTQFVEQLWAFDELSHTFMLGGFILGVICSLCGFILWNKGCALIPVSLAGQFFTTQTLFGLTYVFLIENRLPSGVEAIGMALMFSGVLISLNTFKRQREASANLTSNELSPAKS